MCQYTNLRKQATLRNTWAFGLVSLIMFNVLAIVDVSEPTCGEPFIPILLSRALTTDPWRGLTLGYCLLAISASFTINSSVLTTAFFGFFSAFLVSMFDTPISHDFLIGTSSLLVMFECVPRVWKFDLWTIHWLTIVVIGNICFFWMMYSYFSDTYTQHEERCSWMFITEYITFWLMNALVLWIIPENIYAKDAICEEGQKITAENRRIEDIYNNGSIVTTTDVKVKTKLTTAKTKLLDF